MNKCFIEQGHVYVLYMEAGSEASEGIHMIHICVYIYGHNNQPTHTNTHTPSIAFQHPPPNSARFSYATEGVLFISAQMSSDAVSALRKVWVLI